MSDTTNKRKMTLGALFGAVAIAAIAISGCGTDSYAPPVAGPVLTKTASPLIDAAKLKEWMDQGLVNAKSGEKVVVLDVTTKAEYDKGHIPGAIFVDSSVDTNQTRIEGPASSGFMVPDGSRIDALLQRAGIDEKTTVVFTTSAVNPVIYATRGYFVFRYWGVPKERLKLLDGRNKAWAAAYASSTTAPTVAPASFRVAPNGANNVQAGLRASLGEMISAVGASNTAIIDVRGTGTAAAPVYGAYLGTASPSADLVTTSKYIVFEGHIKGAQPIAFAEVLNAASNDKYLAPANLDTLLRTKGSSEAVTTYVYCKSGTQATDIFFALDAILGWPVVLYDGSWGQWGQMSASTANGGKLPAGSVWATDTAALSESGAAGSGSPVVYNVGRIPTGSSTAITAAMIEQMVDPYAAATFTTTNDFLIGGNQVENEDRAYVSPAVPASSSTSGGGGGGGGC